MCACAHELRSDDAQDALAPRNPWMDVSGRWLRQKAACSQQKTTRTEGRHPCREFRLMPSVLISLAPILERVNTLAMQFPRTQTALPRPDPLRTKAFIIL